MSEEHPKIDPTWVREQLTRSGYVAAPLGGDARLQSMSTCVELLVEKLNAMALPPGDRHEVAQIFSRLAAGTAIAPANVVGDAVWVDLPGSGVDVRSGDSVRVRFDAFTGEPGKTYNGRLGTIVGARGGDLIVQYAGQPDTTGVHLNRDKLQVLQRTTR